MVPPACETRLVLLGLEVICVRVMVAHAVLFAIYLKVPLLLQFDLVVLGGTAWSS